MLLFCTNLAIHNMEQCNFNNDHVKILQFHAKYHPEFFDYVSNDIAYQLMERYPDITRKELVGFFRRSDEQYRERASVLPLPLLQRIWHFVENLKILYEFQPNMNMLNSSGIAWGYSTIEPLHPQNNLLLNLYYMFCRSILGKDLSAPKTYVSYTNTTTTDILMSNGTIWEQLRTDDNITKTYNRRITVIFHDQDYAHITFANKNMVLVLPYVNLPPYKSPTDPDASFKVIYKICKDFEAKRFENMLDALAYLHTLVEK